MISSLIKVMSLPSLESWPKDAIVPMRVTPGSGLGKQFIADSMKSSPAQAMHKLVNQLGDNPIGIVPTPRGVMFFTDDIDLSKKILLATSSTKKGSDNLGQFKKDAVSLTSTREGFGEYGMPNTDGSHWRDLKEVMLSKMSPKAIKKDSLIKGVQDGVESGIQNMKRKLAKSGKVDLVPEVNELTLNVVLQTMFGTDLKKLGVSRDRIIQIMKIGMKNVPLEIVTANKGGAKKSLIGKAFGKYNEAVRELDEIAERVLAARKDGVSRGDLLDGLRSMKNPDGSPVSKQQIKDNIKTMMIAGHESTSSAISWTIHEVLKKPEIQKKLLAEIRQNRGARPEEIIGSKFPYLDKVWKETLRKNPPFGLLGREAREDVTIETSRGRFFFPKGSTVIIDVQNAQRKEAIWGRNVTGYPANEFHPERFDKKNMERLQSCSGVKEGVAFSAGPRLCVGQHLANLEGKLTVVRILEELSPELMHSNAPPQIIEDVTYRLDGLNIIRGK